ncbi:1,2-dihydroxy-3-keto-5-methylthiopentene dioxygenase [Microbotryomycetes sp. JL221]|nr:1,2-dihydroxy-3-keto-5-methylthiopentene dioxygenase [Microbotryomycetes sp. JL221]
MLPWNPPSSFSTGSSHASSGADNSFYNQQQAPSQPWRPSFGQDRSGPTLQQQTPPQHQQQQQQQQPGGQQQSANAANLLTTTPPMTLASVLHFLQTEHRRYAKDRNEWEIERAEMRARIALLEGEKRGNEGALRDLARRCKMLENALRGERSKFMSTTKDALSSAGTHSPSPSGTSSPVPMGPAAVAAASGVAPAKAAHILSNLGPHSTSTAKDATVVPPSTTDQAATMAATSSSSGPTASQSSSNVPPVNHKPSTNGPPNGVTWPPMGTAMLTSAARDPRGKARSRDYLKQCLQEITYLTSSTTLNPLSGSSQAAPTVQRPRKVLPDHVPPVNGPGIVQLPPSTSMKSGSVDSHENPNLNTSSDQQNRSSSSSTSNGSQSTATAQSITKYPSDQSSAFVPLKRTISQPGVPGSAGFNSNSSSTASSSARSIPPTVTSATNESLKTKSNENESTLSRHENELIAFEKEPNQQRNDKDDLNQIDENSTVESNFNKTLDLPNTMSQDELQTSGNDVSIQQPIRTVQPSESHQTHQDNSTELTSSSREKNESPMVSDNVESETTSTNSTATEMSHLNQQRTSDERIQPLSSTSSSSSSSSLGEQITKDKIEEQDEPLKVEPDVKDIGPEVLNSNLNNQEDSIPLDQNEQIGPKVTVSEIGTGNKLVENEELQQVDNEIGQDINVIDEIGRNQDSKHTVETVEVPLKTQESQDDSSNLNQEESSSSAPTKTTSTTLPDNSVKAEEMTVADNNDSETSTIDSIESKSVDESSLSIKSNINKKPVEPSPKKKNGKGRK